MFVGLVALPLRDCYKFIDTTTPLGITEVVGMDRQLRNSFATEVLRSHSYNVHSRITVDSSSR